MSTMDELIQDWMSEDKYLTKLTKRQRSIASNKLRSKLAPYVEEKYTPKLTKRQRSIASKRLSNKLLHCVEKDEVDEVKAGPEGEKAEKQPEDQPELAQPEDQPDVDTNDDKTSPISKRKIIHDWMNEDRLLAKYTKRQKVILCKNLIEKLETEKDRALEQALAEAKEATQELETKLTRYRNAYRSLLRTAYSTRNADRACKMIWVIWLTLILRSIVNTVIASIPQGWCSATVLNQTEPYKTLGLP